MTRLFAVLLIDVSVRSTMCPLSRLLTGPLHGMVKGKVFAVDGRERQQPELSGRVHSREKKNMARRLDMARAICKGGEKSRGWRVEKA